MIAIRTGETSSTRSIGTTDGTIHRGISWAREMAILRRDFPPADLADDPHSGDVGAC